MLLLKFIGTVLMHSIVLLLFVGGVSFLAVAFFQDTVLPSWLVFIACTAIVILNSFLIAGWLNLAADDYAAYQHAQWRMRMWDRYDTAKDEAKEALARSGYVYHNGEKRYYKPMATRDMLP